ncbi:ABC transporter ATP-binding protein [Phreatobacter stygius]|uniref:ABC transporter ATP-binding protein n=1 Tax=Phreatobacter stygius TaxID=1940610 RepID=A0A4D7AW10_9HYPH|nr:ABC transporter ATP-binding protein [Phreatobacter stygius]QCI63108.1 ABC transporter ATP-binding protein [Phreatobacter stygius]
MTSTLLSLSNVETFYGRIMAVRGVSLAVPEGAIVTILGSNGAGKSTILKTISGIMAPRKGTITFQDQPITGLEGADVVRRGISHVPEGREIFPFMTVQENILMGAYLRHDRDAVEREIAAWFETFPILGERARQPAGLLSGGQQQMLAIARAMMSKPSLLLMDEPSLGLSPLLTKQIFAIIGDINRRFGTTILLVEQNARQALATAHFAYVLELGRIVLEGPAAELMENADVKEFYLGLADQGVRGERRWKRKKMWH